MQNEPVNASGFFFCFGDVKTFTTVNGLHLTYPDFEVTLRFTDIQSISVIRDHKQQVIKNTALLTIVSHEQSRYSLRFFKDKESEANAKTLINFVTCRVLSLSQNRNKHN